MPFNGSGVFQRVRNWVADATAGIKIRADYHDAEDDGFAAGLTNCITRDGQSIVTQNIPFNSKRITGLADPVNPQDAATKASIAAQVAATSLPLTGGTITGNLDIDGTLNVDGVTTLNSDLNVNGQITSTPPGLNTYRQISGSYGVFNHMNGSNWYLMVTNAGDPTGGFNGFRPMTLDGTTGNMSFGHTVTVGGALNVGGALTAQGVPVYGNIPTYSPGNGYWTVASDGQKLLWLTGTIVINSPAHVIGTVITFFAWGGDLTIAISGSNGMHWLSPSGPTTGNRTLKQYGVATAHMFASNYWLISGNGLT